MLENKIKEILLRNPEIRIVFFFDPNKSFSRGKNVFGASASMAFVGNTEHSVPYIRYPFQLKLLFEFCAMLSKIKDVEEEMELHVITWNDPEYSKQSEENFYELDLAVEEIGIHLTYEFKQGHDRYILSNNGWKIILGRGLDIYEKPEGRFNVGDIDQERRQCKACEITFLKNNAH